MDLRSTPQLPHSCAYFIRKVANKKLDREKQFHYIHIMFTPTMVLLKAGHKAAWQRIAVAEGGFY